MKVALRYILAIVVGPILGNIAAAIPAIIVDMLAGKELTNLYSGNLTLPNVLYASLMGGATGFFAGAIAARRGKLVAILAQFFPLLSFTVLEIVLNRDLAASYNAAHPVPIAFWTWGGLLPAMIGGYYGERFTRQVAASARGIGRVLGGFTCASAGLVLFFFYWSALTHWLGGFFGSVVALAVSPGVVVFPLIYWFVEGAFPGSYFLLLGACFVGLVLLGVCGEADY